MILILHLDMSMTFLKCPLKTPALQTLEVLCLGISNCNYVVRIRSMGVEQSDSVFTRGTFVTTDYSRVPFRDFIRIVFRGTFANTIWSL